MSKQLIKSMKYHEFFNKKHHQIFQVYYIPNKQARQRLRELMKQAFTNAYASASSSSEASAPSINPPKTLPTQLLTPFQLNAAAFRFPLQNLTHMFTPQAQASFCFSDIA